MEVLIGSRQEAQVRAAIERFHLDPTKAADIAAAVAYVWASNNRALLIATPPGEPGADAQVGILLPESAQNTLAERVMQAVRRDPALLDRALSGDAGALGTIHSIVQTVASALEIMTLMEGLCSPQPRNRRLRVERVQSGSARRASTSRQRILTRCPSAAPHRHVDRQHAAGLALLHDAERRRVRPPSLNHEDAMTYPTLEAIETLNRVLHLPATGREQDWDIELADADRVSEFAAYFEDRILTNEQKQALMALTLGSLEDLAQKKIPLPDLVEGIWRIIQSDVKLYSEVIIWWKSVKFGQDSLAEAPPVKSGPAMNRTI